MGYLFTMFKKLSLLLILVTLMPFSAFAGTPKDFAENLADTVIKIIEAPKSEDAREKDLIALFRSKVDTTWMAGFTMGKNYRTLTPAQKAKYNQLYADYVIYSYIPKFRMYTGERMDVNQVIDEGSDLFTVKTSLKTKASSTGSVFVDYKLKKAGGEFKIVDVIGEGVSLINTQRSDFTAPQNDLGVDGFIARLEEKVKALKANPPKEVKKVAKK